MSSYSLKEILVAFSEGLENHTPKNAKLIKEAIYLLSQYESNPTKENKTIIQYRRRNFIKQNTTSC